MYYSNGNTVEYGSDFIQDLVNLNLAQVNYSTNRNVQTSQADFAGDTRTPGIDIATSPGSVMTINPKQEYSTNTDWLGGSSLTNCKTSNGDFLEVPTQFAPTLVSGSLSGDVQVVGTDLKLPSTVDFTGESHSSTGVDKSLLGAFAHAQQFIPSRTGTLTSFNFSYYEDFSSESISCVFRIYNDSFGAPGAVLYTIPFVEPYQPSSTPQLFTVNLTGLSLALTENTKYWWGFELAEMNHGGGFRWVNKSSGWTSSSVAYTMLGISSPWAPLAVQLQGSYTFVTTPIVSLGSWTSPIYDSGSMTAVSSIVSESGTYPTNCSGDVTILASNDPLMVGAVTQSFSNPNGANSLSLVNYRYWQIVASLLTTDNRTVPTMGTPLLKFDTAAEWVSQPIDTTIDKVAWGTLAYTGNIPLGTSVALTIATSTSQFSGYSSYGAIGSAALDQWAKVKITLATSSDNVTSPAIASVTLTWDVTSTITSSVIDSGTVPSGYNIFQWEQLNPGTGTVLFYVRTAASAGAIPAASFVAVTNGEFPNLSALRYSQWKSVLSSTADHVPEITSVTVSWFLSTGASGVRCSSLFYNKTYYLTVATVGQTANNTVIQLDQFGNWRVQKDISIGTFLSYFNTLYFTDGVRGLTYNGFIADTNNGTPIVMDVRTKAWNSDNDLFLKVPRALKVTGLNTQTTLHAYYSTDRGVSWIELLNESGVTGYTTTNSGSAFTTLFVPDATSLTSGRTLMYRIVSDDIYPCSIINFVPSFYSRKGRYLANG
jgi:hypothetical protein